MQMLYRPSAEFAVVTAITLNGVFFNAQRIVQQYLRTAYLWEDR